MHKPQKNSEKILTKPTNFHFQLELIETGSPWGVKVQFFSKNLSSQKVSFCFNFLSQGKKIAPILTQIQLQFEFTLTKGTFCLKEKRKTFFMKKINN